MKSKNKSGLQPVTQYNNFYQDKEGKDNKSISFGNRSLELRDRVQKKMREDQVSVIDKSVKLPALNDLPTKVDNLIANFQAKNVLTLEELELIKALIEVGDIKSLKRINQVCDIGNLLADEATSSHIAVAVVNSIEKSEILNFFLKDCNIDAASAEVSLSSGNKQFSSLFISTDRRIPIDQDAINTLLQNGVPINSVISALAASKKPLLQNPQGYAQLYKDLDFLISKIDFANQTLEEKKQLFASLIVFQNIKIDKVIENLEVTVAGSGKKENLAEKEILKSCKNLQNLLDSNLEKLNKDIPKEDNSKEDHPKLESKTSNAKKNNTSDLSNTALHEAVKKSDIKLVNKLIKEGANINAKNRYGNTPLNLATDAQIMELLVYNGASGKNILKEINATKANENLMLHKSIKYKNDKSDDDITRLLSKEGIFIDLKDADGNTPLHLMIKNGLSANLIKLIIEKGANINFKDIDGKTPLHLLIENGASKDLVEYMIKRGADFNAQDVNGKTPMHYAAENGYVGFINLLGNNGADFALKSNDNQTPLQLAQRYNNSYAIDALAQIKYNYHIINGDVKTANNLLKEFQILNNDYNKLLLTPLNKIIANYLIAKESNADTQQLEKAIRFLITQDKDFKEKNNIKNLSENTPLKDIIAAAVPIKELKLAEEIKNAQEEYEEMTTKFSEFTVNPLLKSAALKDSKSPTDKNLQAMKDLLNNLQNTNPRTENKLPIQPAAEEKKERKNVEQKENAEQIDKKNSKNLADNKESKIADAKNISQKQSKKEEKKGIKSDEVKKENENYWTEKVGHEHHNSISEIISEGKERKSKESKGRVKSMVDKLEENNVEKKGKNNFVVRTKKEKDNSKNDGKSR